MLTTNGRTPASGFSKAKKALDAAITALAGDAAIPSWVVHDLRRTLSTGMAELRVRLEVAEAVINQVSGTRGGIAGTYNLWRYEREKRQALQRWADHVEKIAGRDLWSGRARVGAVAMSRAATFPACSNRTAKWPLRRGW